MAEAVAEDIVAIYSDDVEPDEYNDKPIIQQLLKRLINKDNKQSTELTNSQIIDILCKEFGINLRDNHELEGEIYVTIMKEWPQWDTFDKHINTLNPKNDMEALNKMLETNYHSLKDYIKTILDSTQILAKDVVSKMNDAQLKSIKTEKKDDVGLEVRYSRQQLPKADSEPTQINRLLLYAIFNWWDVTISIVHEGTYFYFRRTSHKLNKVLVKKSLTSQLNPFEFLPQEFKVKRYFGARTYDATTVVDSLTIQKHGLFE